MRYRIDTSWWSVNQNAIVYLEEFKAMNPNFVYGKINDLIVVTAPFGVFFLVKV